MADGQIYTVEVHFATSSDYRKVGTTRFQDVAEREARAYLSDSRGIRIVMPDGQIKQVK